MMLGVTALLARMRNVCRMRNVSMCSAPGSALEAASRAARQAAILWAMILGVSAADRIMCNIFMCSATGSALEASSYEYNIKLNTNVGH
jgi:hypothetical protein